MAKQKETFAYGSLRQRIKVEWKVYLLAFLFILIADSIGQIQIPIGTGMLILFPIFYAIILGVCSGPQVAKIIDNQQVKAASKLVVVGIAPFIAKLGITAGANIETILNAGPAEPAFRSTGNIIWRWSTIFTDPILRRREEVFLYIVGGNGRYDLLRDIGACSGNDRMV